MSIRILLVEDDAALRTGLADNLELEGWDCRIARTGAEALAQLRACSFDLVLLDWMLPGKSGIDVLRELRSHDRRTPVVLLTAKSEVSDKVLGLELGADDYVTKPFQVAELMARVRVCLRRGQVQQEQAAEKQQEQVESFELGDLVVDLAAFELRRGRETLPISPTEAALLALFYRERGRVVSRARILSEVWNGTQVSNRSIDTHILNLRKKIEPEPKTPKHLVTVHGAGYKLNLHASGA
ncbi:MAG: DNA-binding response regulator [Planctomycetota bacterium]|nr:MAG: DNA-binding response regulator [Planctomycetota bacterium]